MRLDNKITKHMYMGMFKECDQSVILEFKTNPTRIGLKLLRIVWTYVEFHKFNRDFRNNNIFLFLLLFNKLLCFFYFS